MHSTDKKKHKIALKSNKKILSSISLVGAAHTLGLGFGFCGKKIILNYSKIRKWNNGVFLPIKFPEFSLIVVVANDRLVYRDKEDVCNSFPLDFKLLLLY